MIVPKRNPEVVWRLEKGIHEIAWAKARAEEEYEDLGVLTLMFNCGGVIDLAVPRAREILRFPQ